MDRRLDGSVKEAVMGWRRWSRWLVIAVIVAAGGSAWSLTRPRADDRRLLEQLVAKAQRAVEAQAPNEFIRCFARDYRDDAGLYRGDIYSIAAREARSFSHTEVVIKKSDIEIGKREATGHFDVDVTAEGSGMTMPWPMRLEVTFQKRRPVLHPWRTEWVVTRMEGHGLEGFVERNDSSPQRH